MAPDAERPRTFYLNEQHELSRGKKARGGRIQQFAEINWAAKGRHLATSLQTARERVDSSQDPLRGQHYFLLTKPVSEVQKKSQNRRLAPEGTVLEKIDFGKDDSQVFRRLGIDLVEVTDDGEAIVHMPPERLTQLASTTSNLGGVGAREQARWASIDSFEVIPPSLRVAGEWVRALKPRATTDAVIEFQPLLRRTEVDTLLRAIATLLKDSQREGLTGTGMDFSGRHWARGKITPENLQAIARTFYSIQTLHSPLLSLAAFASGKSRIKAAVAGRIPAKPRDVGALPTVAVLDTGVPSDHSILATYRRGAFTSRDSHGSPLGDHGSFVSSRIVFGDRDFGDGAPITPQGQCRYYDVLVATSPKYIDDKSVTSSIETVVGIAPDVRVFNLSFDTIPLDQLDFTKRRENLLLVQDLDNLVFRDDVLVVVSAGNSTPGVQPSRTYPANYDDPQWQLGAWARSFNSLTCGSLVGRLSPGGLVSNLGWPSPFTRVGPGLCDSPKPDFADSGGNVDVNMQASPGLGVWGLTSQALWEDRCGTSFAAPLLARESAFAFDSLQKVCQQGAKPYAVTVKAFLVLTSVLPQISGPATTLAGRALGKGVASAARLRTPLSNSAVLIWQGLLEDSNDIARIEIPIPMSWYKAADKPELRVVVCWDPPVNAAATGLWATRRVTAHLKSNPDSKSLHGTRGAHASYPYIDRVYDLKKLPGNTEVEGDIWLMELSYSQIADYYPAISFTPQQRVALAAEIYDAGNRASSPQAALLALPVSWTMTRLSVPPSTISTPVIIRSAS
jgi:hypothetical protein